MGSEREQILDYNSDKEYFSTVNKGSALYTVAP